MRLVNNRFYSTVILYVLIPSAVDNTKMYKQGYRCNEFVTSQNTSFYLHISLHEREKEEGNTVIIMIYKLNKDNE